MTIASRIGKWKRGIQIYSGIDTVTTGDEKHHHHECSKEEQPTDATSSATERM